jgi:sugar (pentulose or hexulose) kinase
MIYLGSFIGVAQFHVDPRRLVGQELLEHPPYTWQMSLPRFGQTLDNVLALLQLGHTTDSRFERLESILSEYVVGERAKCSVVIDAPAVGGEADPAIRIEGVRPSTTAADLGAAFVERIADGLRSIATDAGAWFASGGGAKTSALPRRLAGMADLKIARAQDCWTSVGAAMAVGMASDQEWPEPAIEYLEASHTDLPI